MIALDESLRKKSIRCKVFMEVPLEETRETHCGNKARRVTEKDRNSADFAHNLSLHHGYRHKFGDLLGDSCIVDHLHNLANVFVRIRLFLREPCL
jgi:undecaprenyl pyrophosphate synthase